MSYQNEKFVIKVNNDYDISNKLLFISFIFQKKKHALLMQVRGIGEESAK